VRKNITRREENAQSPANSSVLLRYPPKNATKEKEKLWWG
jgi:hypothetical protein